MNPKEKEITEEKYEELLNEIYGDVEICGMKYPAGRALRELDPVAFRCGLLDEPIKWFCGSCYTEFETNEEAAECCHTEEAEK